MRESRYEITHDIEGRWLGAISSLCIEEGYDRLILISDTTVAQAVLPSLLPRLGWESLPLYLLPTGEAGKELSVAADLWKYLLQQGATRHTCLCAIGGGAVSDLVGFVAATYMRGIGLVSVPTTLLAAVDAAIGGKCAMNVGGVKNSVGLFYPPHLVLLSPEWLQTLPESERQSGMGEVLKYALLMGAPLYPQLMRSNEPIPSLSTIEACVAYKRSVVQRDPYDTLGLRATLNLGHTTAHALEAWAMLPACGRPSLPHGVGVAVGLLGDLYLSTKLYGFPKEELYNVSRWVRAEFTPVHFSCHDYDELWSYARHDKKNDSATTTLSTLLLSAIGGDCRLHNLSRSLWEESLDYYRDFVGV